jgi:uncharacterized membrane protein
MCLLSISQFIAHLHPVLVHLPIGILVIALILQVLVRNERFASLRPALPVVLLAGLASAVLSCVTGFLLFRTGDYDGTLVSWHMWMALTLTFVSFVFWVRSHAGRGFDRMGYWLGIIVFVLVMVTGHLGGSLTHGEDYLTGALGGGEVFTVSFKTIPDVQQALVYEDIVKPVLQTKCYSCHGPNKQKGGLRLDDPGAIVKGGKDGVVLVAGHGDSSELIKRMLLPEGDEHHMPPKDKSQVTAQQQLLLSWWIDQGADHTKKVKELVQPDKVRPALLALQQGPGKVAEAETLLPEEAAAAADEGVLRDLRKAGVVVIAVAQGSNYLSVKFSGPAGLSLLGKLKKQLVQLDLSDIGVGDSAMDVVGQCDELRSLVLSNTRVTDKGLARVSGLKELRVLNLVGTKVTGVGLLSLQPPKHLHAVYLYHTGVREKDWDRLKVLFKGAVLDSGGYRLPELSTDTAVVRPQVKRS